VTVGEAVRALVIAAFVAALVGGAARVIGVDGPHAVAIGAGVLALVLILLTQRSVVPTAELEPPDLDPPAGGRRDVEQLAWAMVEHRTRIRSIVLDRVDAIAVGRLAAHGLDPRRPEDAAAIESLLGPTAWAVLRSHHDRPVTPRALDATLSALERLPPPGPLAPPPPTDRTSRAD
jgi:hypothetical protein